MTYFTNFDIFEEAKLQTVPQYVYLRSAEHVTCYLPVISNESDQNYFRLSTKT